MEEHHLAHVLIAQLKKLKPSDEKFTAKFIVLADLCKHHIKEEESEILPKAEESAIEWEELSVQVMMRKEQLMAKVAIPSKNGKEKASKKSSVYRRANCQMIIAAGQGAIAGDQPGPIRRKPGEPYPTLFRSTGSSAGGI